ncbi:AAA family ATPase [Sinimarinibacterium sp. CAU 1509]|uniref:ExeA family protein n=1 Tax=Sinimarinibacterium sp. CAU 1509 TaxID=2562283 RepID=UPI0010AC153D|nr:ExeA family protein [Sinimarinibacterium sp. CAU 1509]TJY62912.1 AAA family ATPase [Sinimarinibacterium sp. CAU 1509]
MYAEHFRLREMPFSITPDPAYLYMSPRHQEALGHLLFGTGQYGGFVQLTGEVGTGKTTIVRALLAQHLPDVEVALIHNPRQGELEFVHTICDELHVPYSDQNATLKGLVDALNAHLLKVHAAGRRTVLIIDEAQNLQPSVLEQVRLLTNLETPKEKLLRIILVGQPELSALLARPDLRQLSSRITARYHLMPLSPAETREYIEHRLQIAGARTQIFMPKALALVHRYSQGIPRLINIICDRALLGAYAAQSFVVTPEMIRTAAREVMGELPHVFDPKAHIRWRIIETGWLLALVVCTMLFATTFWPRAETQPAASSEAAVPAAATTAALPIETAPVPEHDPAADTPNQPEAEPDKVELLPATVEPVPEATLPVQQQRGLPVTSVDELARAAQPLAVVMSRLTHLWSAASIRDLGTDLCDALHTQGLECFRTRGDWDALYQVDRPAVITLKLPGGEIRYFLLQSLGKTYAILETAEGAKRVPISELTPLWTGEYLVLWRRETHKTTLYSSDSGPDVEWLQQRLNELGFLDPGADAPGRYSAALDAAVRRFQQERGLTADGVVGTRTLIELGDEQPDTPRLTSGLE